MAMCHAYLGTANGFTKLVSIPTFANIEQTVHLIYAQLGWVPQEPRFMFVDSFSKALSESQEKGRNWSCVLISHAAAA